MRVRTMMAAALIGIFAAGPAAAASAPTPAQPPVLDGWLDTAEVHGYALRLGGPQLTVTPGLSGPPLLVELRSAAGDPRAAGRVGDPAGPTDHFTVSDLPAGDYVLAVSPLATGRGEYSLALSGGPAALRAPLPRFGWAADGARWLRAAGQARWPVRPAADDPMDAAAWELALSMAPSTRLELTGIPAELELDTAGLGEGLHAAAITVAADGSYVSRSLQLLVDNHPSFSDVPAGHWARSEVEIGTELGLTRGYPTGLFVPDGPVTRAELAKLLVTAAGLGLLEPDRASFGDVARQHWAYPYVETARAAGITTGEPAGDGLRFFPSRPVSRAEAAAMVARAARLPLPGGTLPFVDASAVPAWAGPAVLAVHHAALMSGFPGGRFAPADPVTRAQAAAIAVRLAN